MATNVTEKHAVPFEKHRGLQLFRCIRDDCINAQKMVANLNEVVEFHIFVVVKILPFLKRNST